MNICIFLSQGLKSQAAKLLGSVDFLGNPLGLFNDVTEGISGLLKDGNVGVALFVLRFAAFDNPFGIFKLFLTICQYFQLSYILILTFAAELDTPCVTFFNNPPTLPSFIKPDIPSVTSLNKPRGFPKKSTEPNNFAA
jgi:hypothetical protein